MYIWMPAHRLPPTALGAHCGVYSWYSYTSNPLRYPPRQLIVWLGSVVGSMALRWICLVGPNSTTTPASGGSSQPKSSGSMVVSGRSFSCTLLRWNVHLYAFTPCVRVRVRVRVHADADVGVDVCACAVYVRVWGFILCAVCMCVSEYVCATKARDRINPVSLKVTKF